VAPLPRVYDVYRLGASRFHDVKSDFGRAVRAGWMYPGCDGARNRGSVSEVVPPVSWCGVCRYRWPDPWHLRLVLTPLHLGRPAQVQTREIDRQQSIPWTFPERSSRWAALILPRTPRANRECGATCVPRQVRVCVR